MYKDLLFWDRIITEFMDPNIHFRLEVGNEKGFEVPFIIMSKFFWVNAQISLHRLQFIFNGINELIQPEKNDFVQFISSESFVYSHHFGENLMIIHGAFQFIEFDSCGKIVKWSIQMNRHDKYFRMKTDENNADDFVYGFPRKLIEFLDVALVMNSVLPDSSSWLTWFYTYIQQNGLQTTGYIVDPNANTFENDNTNNRQNLDFIERSQNFIFNILGANNVENFEMPVNLEEILQVNPLNDDSESNNNNNILMEELFANPTKVGIDDSELLIANIRESDTDFVEECITEEAEDNNHAGGVDVQTLTDSSTVTNDVAIVVGAVVDSETIVDMNVADDDDFFDNYG